MAGSSQRHYSTVAVVVVVLLTPWTATALPSADGILEHRPTQAVVAPRETFGNGFPPGFADNLPTKEFTGDFTRRVRRQAGITSDIDSILSGPYGGALDNDHLQALLLRNINIRPARQSPGHPRESRPPPRPSLSSSSSSSSTRFSSSPQGSFRPQQESRSPGPPSPGRPLPRPSLSSSASRFSSPPPGSFRPQQEPRSPDPPSADRPSPPSLFQAPRDPPPRFSPPRFTSSNPPLHSQPQERQEPFSSDSFTGQQFDSFSDIDSFFDSARLPRQRRDVAAAAAPRDDAGSTQHIFVSPEEDTVPESSSGFIVGKPADFPGFASIGGFGPMEDVDKTDVAGSFMQTINFPSVEFGPIDDSHPPFPQNPSFPQTPSFPEQKTQDVELNSDMETRRRRGVPDEDEEDPIESQFASLIPHKRVHRVQTESHAPHSRKPREDTDMDTSPAELPHYFSSVSNFEFPRLQPRHRQSPTVSRSAHVTSQFSSHHSPVELRREDRHHPPHTQEPDYLQPDGQRFYPSFNGHISPSSRAPFFPSRPIPPHAPGPRGSRFLTRGVGFRERPNTTPRDPVGFRELHHQGPPVRETSSHIKPDAAFSASRRPFHREQEHFGHDNSILGSGNFEVLRGGTFYDLEDTNGHQHYDHLLHGDDFGFFPAVQPPSPPHTNYVDDFFSNFRDFSEFAKRSDEGESTYVEDEYNPESYSRGYGSEHIHHFAPSNITLEVGNVTLANITEPNTKSENANSSPVTKKNTTTVTGHTKQTHRRPNNIQEVLEEVDSHPSDYTASTTTVEEKDPMIAMF
ncbi:serine/arginine repetitive matrix protein 1-like isoform X2 [Portunus trituberculatus]|uniref:serine/arginine repetitive matrix protein 1-like isoform X2 n=1 Tax=Portunus trituberculatus TaxID=210409 RepID=UPI001E1CEFA9|nr:serine/arginine repetitive matrix protein 1-like isoform X2 [Portunus trituberculatus]